MPTIDLSTPYGVTLAGRAVLASEARGDPLASYPALLREGRRYNRWLTDAVLDPVLRRWDSTADGAPPPPAAIAADIGRACAQAQQAFRDLLPTAERIDYGAVIVAMGVTANLERTLALLGECLLGPGPAAFPPPPFLISRCLCGLMDYPESTPYFPGRLQAPIHAASLRSRRGDLRHLGNALWCSAGEIQRTCEAAVGAVREDIRRGRPFR